ncbi:MULTISPECIES: saccharopine dehydrogenase NADP-binding domain-containing protein [unclassified Novosphingobium]|uniref:saccharopine dehydrogenase NADP-binding domain-containing protein n=1 Tax=unclassified Novosphingobium TaxID=2644732 RepID=UPI0025F6863A|nr:MULTISPECIES: saccharopine dehydrogenase NADP-binding domain-containing protein [unclassified Novosphingobium]HQV03005.1 saccharopine dehydrogenase NADP-binding domain-containing protein [Novosphingobium sp.]
MTARILILGGYGNFGGYVARALASDPAITLIIAGRSLAKAQAFAATLAAANPAEATALDIDVISAATLAPLKADLVIHTVGPFQRQDYRVAEAAIGAGAHYCDLADARHFVRDVGRLDAAAKAAGVAVIAGASSVPCLTAAYLDDALSSFAVIEEVDYGISAAQQTNRGLGTASAILSYIGRPFTMLRGGAMRRVFGWQGLHSEVYPVLGRRWFGYCDIPDLDLFPQRYPGLRRMRFCAGHEIALLHFGTWLLGWGVRLHLLPRLDRWGAALLKASFWFDPLGSGRSGFHMRITGQGRDGKPLERREWMIARSGHGPNIPCMPVILIARRIARGVVPEPGARPCLDIIALDEYLAALEGLDITVIRQ